MSVSPTQPRPITRLNPALTMLAAVTLVAAITNAPAADQNSTNTATGHMLLTGSLGGLVRVSTNEVPAGLLPPPAWD